MLCRRSWLLILPLLIFVFLFNEYIVYYLAFSFCSWPANNRTNIIIIADTHLLGVYRGHWFDKLRREWQMHRAFQTAVFMLQPHAVFFLGDLFDEGLLGSDEIFNSYVKRFESLFDTDNKINKYVVMGNHDVGYHHEIFLQRINRFTRNFKIPATVEQIDINGNIFILVNSMAMESDGCRLCVEAKYDVMRIAQLLNCTREYKTPCKSKLNINYSRPILMQHFPLYRRSDEICKEAPDAPPSNLLTQKFKEKFDCLSAESTNFLIKQLHPRASFGGHTHFGCEKWWDNPANFWEYTVPSFSWRNNHRPSFMLLSISPAELSISRCFLPDEYVVIGVYVVALLSTFCVVFVPIFCSYFRKRKRQFSKKSNAQQRQSEAKTKHV